MPVWLFIYLLVGFVNCVQFAERGQFTSLVEVLFYLLLWPAQVGFLVFVALYTAMNWVGERILP